MRGKSTFVAGACKCKRATAAVKADGFNVVSSNVALVRKSAMSSSSSVLPVVAIVLVAVLLRSDDKLINGASVLKTPSGASSASTVAR